ncbi:MAG: hypothetical protein CFH33_00007 [Alphaproteobacteria bacterium MarineAlpha9_Bin3]|nr:MAG: hypothetical protein CFH33_00007 [Alphaproteobacteria bacterium MarineAlpha9_Bin3]|tara:strand:- start:1812 stop:2546 length:735 start_codon:yes stop_codon:yes gene_type:complete
MRLRQIAIASYNLNECERLINKELKINTAYRDEEVEQYGLNNIVCPIGGEFLEVVSPFTTNTTAGRFIDKKKGPAGYMTIFQCADSLERRNFIESKSIRSLNSFENGKYSDFIINQYHPKDLPGALVEIDSVRNTNYKEKYADWPPAGKKWRQYINEDYVTGIVGATIANDNPEKLAEIWSEVLDSDLITKKNIPNLLLENASIKFVQSKNNYNDLVGIDIKASKQRLNLGRNIKLLGLDINFI